jgi:hypothetical protein
MARNSKDCNLDMSAVGFIEETMRKELVRMKEKKRQEGKR